MSHMSGGRQDTLPGFPGPSLPCLPFSDSPTAAGTKFTLTQTAVPEHARQGHRPMDLYQHFTQDFPKIG